VTSTQVRRVQYCGSLCCISSQLLLVVRFVSCRRRKPCARLLQFLQLQLSQHHTTTTTAHYIAIPHNTPINSATSYHRNHRLKAMSPSTCHCPSAAIHRAMICCLLLLVTGPGVHPLNDFSPRVAEVQSQSKVGQHHEGWACLCLFVCMCLGEGVRGYPHSWAVVRSLCPTKAVCLLQQRQ